MTTALDMTHSSPALTKYLRAVVLVVLVLQTSLTVIFLRYSRTHHEGEPYTPTTVVFLTECLKYSLCLLLLLLSQGSLSASLSTFTQEVVHRPRETLSLAVPACLYTMQNNLLILALTNLDAATFQVTYQLKILTTAGFSVLLLERQLVRRQWLALLLLMVGVAMVQIPETQSDHSDQQQDKVTGFMAVLVACFSSGYAGVFYEKLVKSSSQPSVIIRNLQLGLFSLLFSLSGMIYYSSEEIATRGMFYGYTKSVMAIIVLQSLGGLVVAATIKFADNILKGFATSISIIVSTVLSWYVLDDLLPGPYFLAGTMTVVMSSLMYGLPLSQLCGLTTPLLPL